MVWSSTINSNGRYGESDINRIAIGRGSLSAEEIAGRAGTGLMYLLHFARNLFLYLFGGAIWNFGHNLYCRMESIRPAGGFREHRIWPERRARKNRTTLDAEIAHFEKLKASLLEANEGRYALIGGHPPVLLGVFITSGEAYRWGLHYLGNVPMLIRKIGADREDGNRKR